MKRCEGFILMPDLDSSLKSIKEQKWFYEFELPDGSRTESYLDEIARPIHTTREKVLRRHLGSCHENYGTALDVSCHEGYFSYVLADYVSEVIGIDKNAATLDKAKLLSSAMGKNNIQFIHSSLEAWDSDQKADFVLCFGLLYHVENPISVLKKLVELTTTTLCLETQVLPCEISGYAEDGSYRWLRELQGSFGICFDYPQLKEGGLTELALIPSKKAVEFLLKHFGCSSVSFYVPEGGDYEQFVRQQRVIVFAHK
jgi:tRNA (mo5U34)-methyltransferase